MNSSLNCLSAFGRIGTRRRRRWLRTPCSEVSIAFRLSDELGPRNAPATRRCVLASQLPFGFRTNWDGGLPVSSGALAQESQLPFGFRTNWDRNGRSRSTMGRRVSWSQLPFGFRTNWDSSSLSFAIASWYSGESQLPFGFRTNWDEMAWNGEPCFVVVNVSIAFRLSDELGLSKRRSLRCEALEVSIAFRLSDELGLSRNLHNPNDSQILVSIAFRLSDELGRDAGRGSR